MTKSVQVESTVGSTLTGVGHEPYTMTHHTHFVQTGLPIEEDKVAITQMSLDNPAQLQGNLATPVVLQVDAFAGVADDVTCTGVFIRAVAD